MSLFVFSFECIKRVMVHEYDPVCVCVCTCVCAYLCVPDKKGGGFVAVNQFVCFLIISLLLLH